jgi:hypothetical protein
VIPGLKENFVYVQLESGDVNESSQNRKNNVQLAVHSRTPLPLPLLPDLKARRTLSDCTMWPKRQLLPCNTSINRVELWGSSRNLDGMSPKEFQLCAYGYCLASGTATSRRATVTITLITGQYHRDVRNGTPCYCSYPHRGRSWIIPRCFSVRYSLPSPTFSE